MHTSTNTNTIFITFCMVSIHVFFFIFFLLLFGNIISEEPLYSPLALRDHIWTGASHCQGTTPASTAMPGSGLRTGPSPTASMARADWLRTSSGRPKTRRWRGGRGLQVIICMPWKVSSNPPCATASNGSRASLWTPTMMTKLLIFQGLSNGEKKNEKKKFSLLFLFWGFFFFFKCWLGNIYIYIYNKTVWGGFCFVYNFRNF